MRDGDVLRVAQIDDVVDVAEFVDVGGVDGKALREDFGGHGGQASAKTLRPPQRRIAPARQRFVERRAHARHSAASLGVRSRFGGFAGGRQRH